MVKKVMVFSIIAGLITINVNSYAFTNEMNNLKTKNIIASNIVVDSKYKVNLLKGQSYEFKNNDSSNWQELLSNCDMYSNFDYAIYDSKRNMKEQALNSSLYYKNISIPPEGKVVVTIKKVSSGRNSIEFSGDSKSICGTESKQTALFYANLMEGQSYEFKNTDLSNRRDLLSNCDMYSCFDYVTYDSKGNLKEEGLNSSLYYKNISIPSGGRAVVTIKKVSSGRDSIEFAGDYNCVNGKEIKEMALFGVKLKHSDSYEFRNNDLINSKELLNNCDTYSNLDYVIYDRKGNIKENGLNTSLYYKSMTIPPEGKVVVTIKGVSSGRDSIEFAGDYKSIGGKEVKETALFGIKLMNGESCEFRNTDSVNSKELLNNCDTYSNLDYVIYDRKGNIKESGLNTSLYYRSMIVPPEGKAVVTVKKVSSGRDSIEFAGDYKSISGK